MQKNRAWNLFFWMDRDLVKIGSQIETLISQGVDCIIVQPYDAAASGRRRGCSDAEIQVLVTKTTIEDNSICPFVGQDDVVGWRNGNGMDGRTVGGKGRCF